MISGVEEVAYEEGYQLVPCESKHDAVRERMDVEAPLAIRVDGLIIAPAIEAEGAVLGHLHEVRRRALRAIRQRGLRIPEDIALVGFGNDPWTAWLEPPLSSVMQPMLETGRLAARLLLGLLREPAQAADNSLHCLPAGLLIRESMGGSCR